MLLKALVGKHSGIGSNQDNEAFAGEMNIQYEPALNCYLMHYAATLDSNIIHQEFIVFSPQLDGSYQALGHYSELKSAIPHSITTSTDAQLIMTSPVVDALDGYRSEFIFTRSDDVFSYKNRWGFGGELADRSHCEFVLL